MYVGGDPTAICLTNPRVYNPNVSRVSSLYRLQQLDLELDKLNVRLDEIERLLQDTSETRRLKDELTRAETELMAVRNSAQSAEHAVLTQRDKIKSTEAKLYGGQVQNPKELQDLQAESESLKRYLETLEDRYLEAMLEQDQAQETHDALQQSLEQATAAQSSLNTELAEERQQIGQQQADLAAAREAAAAGVSREDRQTYAQLRQRLGGVAIASMQDNSCSMCGLTLSAATQQAARSGDELVRCSQCHRVLYGG